MSLWNVIRLELDPTSDFPEGSASRAYMLCVPLDAHYMIDEAELARQPAMATVRRFWPNEPDRSGYLVRRQDRWAVHFEHDEGDDENLVSFDSGIVRLGDCLSLRKPDGCVFPFRVVSVRPDGCACR